MTDPSPDLARIVENLADEVDTLQESIASAATWATMAGGDWVAQLGQQETLHQRGLLTEVTRLCRTSSVMNPLLRRALSLRAAYVWGSGVSITAVAQGGDGQDVNAVVQAFLDTPGNQLVEDLIEPVNERSLGTDGNVFLAHFTNPTTGAVQVRRLPWDQVTEIVTNPEDSSEPWYYLREWSTVQFDAAGKATTVIQRAFYPALRYRPLVRPKQIAWQTATAYPIYWDAPVLHMAVNRLDGWAFGTGDLLPAVDWARAYSVFLEDWAKLVKSLSTFAWRATTKGSKTTNVARQIAAAAAGATIGGAVVETADQTLEAIPKTGATIDSDSGRPLAAMVAAATDVPVTMLLGDPGVTGARATAETLDRPTELMAQMRRNAWSATFQASIDYVIDQAIKAPSGPLKGTVIRDPYTGRETYTLADGTDRTLDIQWPDLSETPVDVLVKAIVAADSTQKLPPLTVVRLLLNALGVDDVDEIIDEVTDDQGQFIDPSTTAGDVAVRAFRNGHDPAAIAGDPAQQD